MTEQLVTICTVCSKTIKVMCFKNTGVCCEACRKDRDHDWQPAGTLSNDYTPRHSRL